MKRYLLWILIVIFVLGFIVRLYRFDNPIADWHSFRQSDTNAVSVIYARDGIDLLHPRFFDISNLASGTDNPHGYRMVEFPIYNAVQVVLAKTIPAVSLEGWGRIITIVMSLLAAFFIYLLTKKYADLESGVFAAVFFLFIPYSIFYGRVILPDPASSMAILGGIYFFDKYLSSKKPKLTFFVLSILFTALSFLLKPYALFFTLPMIYLAWKKYEFKIIQQWPLYLFAILSIAPFVLWRWWIGHYPEGIAYSDWLFNKGGIRFRPAFFRWIFYERITKLIAGYAGVVFIIAGVVNIIRKKNLFFLSFVVSCLLYVSVIAAGNVQHDYYQIYILPTVSMLFGIGLVYLYKYLAKRSNNFFAAAFCVVVIFIAFFYSWLIVRDYFNINDRAMVAAALKAREILPQNEMVIAPLDGSTTFLNLIERPGWPLFETNIENLIKMGADYMVIASPTKNDISGFGATYKSVASSSGYLILKLKLK